MNVSCEVRNGYLYVTVAGEYHPATARQVFLEWLQVARRNSITRVLCDISRITGFDDHLALTMTHMEIAKFVGESLPRDIKLAVLENPHQFAKDRFDENVMLSRGASVKVTLSFEEALAFLAVSRAEKRLALRKLTD